MQKSDKQTIDLNAEQLKAVQITTGPTLVVAGAGTGKTRVIVERIQQLLAGGTSQKRILALTFTEKAALEMQDRIAQVTGAYQVEVPIMTFNAYGESLLRRYGADIGLGRNFRLMGENAQIVFLRERLDQLKLDYFAPISKPDGQLGDISDYFSHLKQNVISPAEYSAYAKKLPTSDDAAKLDKTKHIELAGAYETYIKLCREANVIDYDDQIYLLIDLLLQRPNVLKEVQDSYDYVMVDEFQDTNAMQSRLVDMIVAGHKNLFVVGDDDQSIYGWRGATLANILDFKVRYPKAAEITLIKNYRSTKEILASAYQLIQHNNPHRLEERLRINKKLVSERSGATPAVICFETLDGELHWIAEDIKRRLKQGTPASAIAVLARRNLTIQRLHDRFDYAGIDHVVVGQRFELYKEPIVRSLLEALKAVVEPSDNTSLYHTLVGPLFSLPVGTVGDLSSTARQTHQSLYTVIQESILDNLGPVQLAVKQLERWREQSASLSVGQLTYEILDSSGYKDRLYQMAANDETIALAVSRMAELFSSMKEFEAVALQPSAVQYIEALPALQAAGDSNEDGTLDLSGEVINILSIHKAKGLEWPIVYIADCTEGSFPLANRTSGIALPHELTAHTTSEADEHMAEERRLMYVAMTRAKDELILTHAERHSSASKRKPSRFLVEAFDADSFEPARTSVAQESASMGSFGNVVAGTVQIPPQILDNQHVSLSISQVKKYLDCPYDFYYRYVLNVPQEPSPAQAYGTIMHGLIEDINRARLESRPVKLGDLKKQLKSLWPTVGYLSAEQRERAFTQAKTTLKRAHERLTSTQRIPLSIEEPFRATLKEYDVTLRGRFDAVLPLGDGVEIVDYKTSTSVDTPEKAKQRATGSEQLTFYALAWECLHDELPELVTLDYVDTGVTGSVKKTSRGIAGAKDRLQKVADGIRAKDFTPGKDHRYCLHPPN